MTGPKLPIPAELAGVSQRTLRDFLVQYSSLLCDQFAPGVTEGRVRAFVNEVLSDAATGQARPADLALEFKHVCRFSGCNLDDCQLCRNNPSKVCEPSTIFDRQYWVRDDGKGGQVIKARCGSDVAVQLLDRGSGQSVVLPDVAVKLYVVSGQHSGPPGVGDPAGGLYLADDGHPLFAAAGPAPEDDGALTLELVQDAVLGGVARLPDFQFLGKNSKFKAGGRTYKSFKLLARAVRTDAVTGRQSVLAQVESDSFKVTTKKGYDGCRKAEYLFAHQPITDKTFATLGETTISNLKTTFEGVETVEDLMRLVQASATAPELQARLRDTLNMSRDTDKWKKLTRMLSERVVWDDSINRVFVVPTGTRPIGLLFRTNKGQVDFDNPIGLVYNPPLPTGQLRAVRTNDRSLAGCGRYADGLKQLAATYWGLNRHPGWALVPDQPKWEHATAATVAEVFMEVVGQDDPVTAAEIHLMNLAANLQATQAAAAAAAAAAGPTGSAGLNHPSPVRSPTPRSSDNAAAAVAAVMAAAGSSGLLSGTTAGGPAAAAAGGSGGWLNPAGMGASSGVLAGGSGVMKSAVLPLSVGMVGSGGMVSPFEGAIAMAGTNAGAFAPGGSAGGTLEDLLSVGAAGGSRGFNQPAVLTVPAFTSSGMMLVSPGGQPGHVDASPFALPATSMMCSGRSTSGITDNTSDTSHSPPQLQATLQQQQQQLLQPPPRNAKSLAFPPQGAAGSGRLLNNSLVQQGVPLRTVSGPAGPAGFAAGPVSAGMMGSMGGGRSDHTGCAQLTAAALQAAGLPVSSASAGAAMGQLVGTNTQQGLGFAGPSGGMMQPAAVARAGSAVPPHAQGPFAAMQQLPPGQALQLPQQQQQQQQQGGQFASEQPQPFSNNTLLLQRAIIEGWPAPQMKALLDQMSDEELQQLVELHAASEAAVNAAATGGAVPAALPQGALAAGAAVAGLQGFGSSIGMPSTSTASGSGRDLLAGAAGAQAAQLSAQQHQQVQQLQFMQQQQQQPGGAAGPAGAAATPAQPQLQQQGLLLPGAVQTSSQQQSQQQQQSGDVDGSGPQPTTSTAAAALSALFADAGVGGPDVPRLMSDVQLTGGLPAGLLGLDSFTDINQWGDLLNDLRHINSGSGNPPGSGGPGLTGVNSLSTDWIPDLLSKRSARFEAEAAAAAAAPGGGGAGSAAAAAAAAAGGGAGQPGSNNQVSGANRVQQAEGDPGASGAVVEGDKAARRGKRVRSKTGQAPSAEQKQEWQTLFGVDEEGSDLRSVSKADAHYDSFNRHFPVARLTSKTPEVHQGAQVAHPWAPGQRLADTGVVHPPGVQPISPDSPNPFAAQQLSGSPIVSSPAVRQSSSPMRGRPPVTTDSVVVPDATRTISGTLDGVTAGPIQQGGSAGISAAEAAAAAAATSGGGSGGGGPWRSATPPLTAPLVQTEEGAAAVESLTGLRASWGEGGMECSQPSGSGLRGILELCGDAGGLPDGLPGAGGVNILLACGQLADADAAAVAAAAAADNPFAVAAREPMAPPAPQLREASTYRDSFARHNWITGLFRRSSSSWSSKSNSGAHGSGGSGSGPSGGSHSSKDPAPGLTPTGSVRGPAAAGL